MARVLIVGCGGRGQALARELGQAGHAVRGTSRGTERADAIEAAGAEAEVADPNLLGTLLPLLSGVTVVCWLMGSATGDSAEALNGDRLETILAKLVDSGVRGFVYEAAGSVDDTVLARGRELAEEAAARHTMPVAVLKVDPADREAWVAGGVAAVDQVLAG